MPGALPLENGMLFITDDVLSRAVRDAVKDAKRVKLAVAFWGKGATALVGLDEFEGRAQIVCDAFSGACNPDVLLDLMTKHDVHYASGMHAKVYWTPASAVIGSANASVNGLRHEEESPRFEAAVRTTDPAVLKAAKDWFDTLFQSCQALKPSDIDRVRKVWEKTQTGRLTLKTDHDSLLRLLVEAPQHLANRRWFVMVMSEGEPSRAAKKAYREVGASEFGPERIARYKDDDVFPFYEDEEDSGWDVRPEDVFVDFVRGPRGGMSFTGLWQVRKNVWRHQLGKGGSLVWVDEIDDLDGKTLTPHEARKVGAAIKKIVAARKDDYEIEGYLSFPLAEVRAAIDEE